MQLYGSTNKKSFNTLKIRVALAECGAAYEFVPVDLDKGEHKTPAFLALNPHGKVPLLVDGDFALPESNAILWYVGESFPAAQLLPPPDASPASRRARAQVVQWCDFASTTFYAAYVEWWNSALGEPEKRHPEAAAAAIAKIQRGLGVLEAVLADRPHLTGAYSLADVANASIVFALTRRLPEAPLAAVPRVRAWYDRVSSRPAFAGALHG